MGHFVRVAAVAITAMALAAPAASAEMGWKSQRWISPDGEAVTLVTRDQLVPQDTDTASDIYLWDSGTYRLVSTGSGGGSPWFVSDDGDRVLFHTTAPLDPADTDRQIDIYLYEGGQTTYVSTGPTDPGSVTNEWPDETGIQVDGYADDGRTVFFDTFGRMVPEDTDSDNDVYKREGGVTTLVSTDRNGNNAPGSVRFLGASDDGERVVMSTTVALLPEDADGGKHDAYAREGSSLELVTKGVSAGVPAGAGVSAINSDAESVVFDTTESLDPRDTDVTGDIYQRRNGATRLISANEAGLSVPCAASATDPRGLQACYKIARGQSDDGAHVFFTTLAPMVTADRNQATDLYDRVGSTTSWVSTGPQTTAETRPELVLYRDGHVLFNSDAPLASGGPDGGVFDRFAGTTRFLGFGTLLAASSDAGRVLFESYRSLVPEDTDGRTDLYQNDGGTIRLVSTGPADDGVEHWHSFVGQSDDGSKVFFQTRAPLTPDDTDTDWDIYRWAGGATTLIGGQVNGS